MEAYAPPPTLFRQGFVIRLKPSRNAGGAVYKKHRAHKSHYPKVFSCPHSRLQKPNIF